MSAYPMSGDVLKEKVRALAEEISAWPSRRQIMRACRVGAPRADAVLAELRRQGFDPRPERVQEQPEVQVLGAVDAALDEPVEATTEAAELAGEALVTGAAGAVHPRRVRGVPRWPLLIIAAGAFVAIWGGWVGLGELTGFGPINLLPGIGSGFTINSAITLPIGMEAYASMALAAWLSPAPVSRRARRFARASAIGALVLGALGQVAFHLMEAAGMTAAPWPITAFVACLPVLVLGCGAALVHLLQGGGPGE